MLRIPGARRLLHIGRTRAGIGRAVDDELHFHFDMTVRDLMANSMTPDEARKEAEHRFGDVGRTRARLEKIDRARLDNERRAEWWSAFAQDLRYALRGLRLKPGFALAVIVTLGLGIGANATMFGIVDRLLFRPPAFLATPERGARIYLARMIDGKEHQQGDFGYRRFADIRDGTTSFDAIAPFYSREMAVGEGQATKEMRVAVSSADLWKLFDIKPAIGRFFTPAEDVPPNGTLVAVLSYAYWQTQFGGRTDVLGTALDIGPAKYTIIGVAPDGFSGYDTQPPIAFIPISAHGASIGASLNVKAGWNNTYTMTWFSVYARRKPGVSIQRANADLTNAYNKSYLAQTQENPKSTPLAIAKPHAFAGPVLVNRGPDQSAETRVATWLIGVAGIVLLIACANVANLLLARALRRRREIAVRIALGVSRARLLTQLMTESLLLAALGGLAGLTIAQFGGTVVRRAILDIDTPAGAFNDPRMLICVAVLAALAGLFTGLVPAFQAGRADVAGSLKAGAREGTVHRSRIRVALLVTQAALSVVLLVGAGLFVRSLRNVQHVRLGYDTEQVLWVNLEERGVKMDSVQRIGLREQLLRRAKSLASVEEASRGLTVPFWSTWEFSLFVPGIDSVSKLGDFTLQAGSPSLFKTLGTRLIRGRGITAEDRSNAPRVMVVNEGMAKRLWPNEDAIGKCVRVNADTNPCTTVVGISEDVRRGSLSEPEFHYYMPIEQFARSQGGLFIRTHAPAATQVEQIRRSLQQLMPGVSYVTVTPMETIIGNETRSWRLGATMFTVFGALALVLAAIGLYSVIAYNVTQRMHEMGVRVALGARGRDVIHLIVREGLAIVLPGVALGAIIALFAGKWIAPLLFDVSPRDPRVIASVVVTLLIVAAAASWVPALRAARVDPNEALRSD
jgi:putative ABC transport system permease protein